MPNKETDVHCNNKKKHIGNDYVIIVYNDSGEEYDLRTMKVRQLTDFKLENISDVDYKTFVHISSSL